LVINSPCIPSVPIIERPNIGMTDVTEAQDLNELMLSVKELTRKAGLEIMKAKENGIIITPQKTDGYTGKPEEGNDVVTSADLASNDFLGTELPRLNNAVIKAYGLENQTEIKVVSEEGKKLPDIDEILKSRAYWVIDPLDGTLYFKEEKKGFYSVNVALIIDGQPVLGAVYVPDTGELFFGDATRKIAMHEQWSIEGEVCMGGGG